MERALMVIGTGKLFTVLAMAGGSGVFCQDYKSNPAKALPSHQACSYWSHCSSRCLMASLPSSLSYKFHASRPPQLIWTVTIIHADSSYLLQINYLSPQYASKATQIRCGGDLVHTTALHIWGNQEVFRGRTQFPMAKSFTKVAVSALYSSLTCQISDTAEIRH